MAYGSGTLFQRGKKGIWYYQAWVNGKQIGPFSSRSTNRRDASRELDKLLGKRARGEVLESRRGIETVADLITAYLAYCDEQLKSADIIRAVCKKHIIPHLGKLKLAVCDVQRLRKYRQIRRAEEADDVTINRELSYLRATWRRAQREQHVSHVPYFPIVKEDNARQGFLTELRFLAFMGELPEYLRGFACCAYYGGMRRGEILNLKPWDVDMERRYLSVRRSKNDDPRAVPILEGPMVEWLTWSLTHCSPDCLWVRPDGRPVTNRNFYDDWHAASKRAGVDGFIPHDSRRSASRNMRDSNVPQAVRMKIMGQRTPSMDTRYGIVDLADVDLVRERMNAKTTANTTAGKKRQKR